MKSRHLALLLGVVAAGTTLLGDGNAGARERSSTRRQPQQEQPGLDVTDLNPDVVRKSFLGTWNDQLGRFWFRIDDIAGDQVRSAQFYLAHLKNGHIAGNRLTLISVSCVPLIGCYDYMIDGKLISLSRMDMQATDEGGDTVHFILTRK
jgi:hypothetical protein